MKDKIEKVVNLLLINKNNKGIKEGGTKTQEKIFLKLRYGSEKLIEFYFSMQKDKA